MYLLVFTYKFKKCIVPRWYNYKFEKCKILTWVFEISVELQDILRAFAVFLCPA
jgi:hypothetical protein